MRTRSVAFFTTPFLMLITVSGTHCMLSKYLLKWIMFNYQFGLCRSCFLFIFCLISLHISYFLPFSFFFSSPIFLNWMLNTKPLFFNINIFILRYCKFFPLKQKYVHFRRKFLWISVSKIKHPCYFGIFLFCTCIFFLLIIENSAACNLVTGWF